MPNFIPFFSGVTYPDDWVWDNICWFEDWHTTPVVNWFDHLGLAWCDAVTLFNNPRSYA